MGKLKLHAVDEHGVIRCKAVPWHLRDSAAKEKDNRYVDCAACRRILIALGLVERPRYPR